MPLSDHEQRMLDQIESALYAEDPKFASSVRGGTLRAPSTRRRLQGAALFVVGLAMLVSGVAFKATRIGGSLPILSVFGFVVMFGGVVFAITGPRVAGGRDRSARSPARHGRSGQRVPAGRSPAAWRTGSAAASTSSHGPIRGVARTGLPLFCGRAAASVQVGVPTTPHRRPRTP